jgi:hypothetical protein
MKVAIGKVAVHQAEIVEARRAVAPLPQDPVEALRQRLAGRSAREHVLLDFLADDLRESREALGHVQAYLHGIERAVADPRLTQQQLLALALGGGPIDQLDYLAELLANTRRRLAQVAARM